MRGRNNSEWADLVHRRRMVAQLDAVGHSVAAIALMLNVCRKTIERDKVVLGIQEPKAPPITPEELARAREMLAGGCHYAEVGRTMGRAPNTIKRHIPGYELNRSQIAELAAAGRWMARLERAG